MVLENLPVPSIHFSTGTSSYLESVAAAGGDVIGVDWRIELDAAWKKNPDRAIQGNLDPAHLLMPQDQLAREIRKILQQAGGRPGHIFNLGHGVFPETPIENVALLVEQVQSFRFGDPK